MKKLLVLALVAAMAGGAMAELEPFPNQLGIFFDDYTGRFPDQLTGPVISDAGTNSNIETTSGFNGPFAWAYLVLMWPTVDTLEGLEFGVKMDVDWAFGFGNNFLFGDGGGIFDFALNTEGSNFSAIVIWPAGFPLDPLFTPLMRFKLENWWGGEPVNIKLGPMWHATHTIPGFASYSLGNDKIPLTQPVDAGFYEPDGYATVATLFCAGVIATEDHTLSSVKALFR